MANPKNQRNVAGEAKGKLTNAQQEKEQNSIDNIKTLKDEIKSIFENKNNVLFQKLNIELSNAKNQNRIARNQELHEKIPQIEIKILKSIDEFCLFFENHADYVVIKERRIVENNKVKFKQIELYDYKLLIAKFYREFICDLLIDFQRLDFIDNLAYELADLLDVENKEDSLSNVIDILNTLINDFKVVIYDIVQLKSYPIVDYACQIQIYRKFDSLQFELAKLSDYTAHHNTLILKDGTKLRHYNGNWEKIQYYIDNYLDITSKLSYIHNFLYQLELGNFEQWIGLDKEEYLRKRMLFKKEDIIAEFNQLGIVDSFIRFPKVRDSFAIRKAYNTLNKHFEVLLTWKEFCRFVTNGGNSNLINIVTSGGGATLLYKVVKLLVDESIIINSDFVVNGKDKTYIMKEALNDLTKNNLIDKFERFEAEFLKELGIS